MDKIELRLTEAQVNQVLHCISLRPYAEVFQLIDNIRKQATVQLEVQAYEREHIVETLDQTQGVEG